MSQQGIPDDRVHVSGFLGAPSDWGLLLTTISVGPRRPTAIATFAEKIAIACEDAVNVYDAVTFSLEQSLRIPESVTRIQGSTDGSILYSTHSRSVALWDIQTGGIIDTFHTRSGINDTAVSPTDGHIACYLSDLSVACRNGRTKNEGSFLGYVSAQPVVTICWLSPAELAVATKNSIYIINVETGIYSGGEDVLDHVWGVVVLSSDELMVGISKPDEAEAQAACNSSFITYTRSTRSREPFRRTGQRISAFRGQLRSPMHVTNKVACITPSNEVQVFKVYDARWTKPPLLEKVKSLAVSLGKNLVVQTEDSVQILSLDVLESETPGKDKELIQMYPLGENHAVCLRTDRCLTVIELETLQSLRPNIDTSSLESPLKMSSASTSCSRGLVAEFGIPMVVRTWRSLAPLPKLAEGAGGDTLLGGSSPSRTLNASLYGLTRRELRLKAVETETTLAKLPIEDGGFKGTGVAYDLTFDSETRFHLKVDGPGYHLKIPYDIIALRSGWYTHTIKQGEPVPLSQPRTTSPYTFDINCEWVLDSRCRKICWIPPDIMRRGVGGHFWVGASLVMLSSDGVVSKLSFRDPDC